MYTHAHKKTLTVGHVHVHMHCYTGPEADMNALEQDLLDESTYHPFSSNEPPLSPCHKHQQTHSPQHTTGQALCEAGLIPLSTDSYKPPSKKKRKKRKPEKEETSGK